jgi:transposase
MAKSYRPWAPTQSFLLPPSPLEWLPEGHLAYFVLEVVQTLDLSEIEGAIQAKDGRGERPYTPQMMLALLVYGYCLGVFSSRRIARASYEDVAFRVLAGGEHPHYTTVNQFRLDHRGALAKLFVQVLRMCERAGLVKLGHVAIDGSKVAAAASKHKAMSYDRMQKEERRLMAEVEALLTRAEETDQREDELYGVGKAPEGLPEELRRREERLKRIREAKAALEQEAALARAEKLREQADVQRKRALDAEVEAPERKRAATRAKNAEEKARELSGGDDDQPGSGGATGDLPHHQVPATPDGKPKPRAQRNFTDPDSRIMVKGGEVVQAYNAQIAVDGESQVIVAEAVTNQSPDQEHLTPMLDRIIENCNQVPAAVTADSGYFSQENAAAAMARDVDAYIAVGRDPARVKALVEGPPTYAQHVRAQMAAKLRTPEGKATYARRKAIVEPVFGQIKQALGFRRFTCRGIERVRAEWSFVCAMHNLLKLFRYGGYSTEPEPQT